MKPLAIADLFCGAGGTSDGAVEAAPSPSVAFCRLVTLPPIRVCAQVLRAALRKPNVNMQEPTIFPPVCRKKARLQPISQPVHAEGFLLYELR